MTNLEWVFNNWDDDYLNVSVCVLAYMSIHHETCDDENCFECEFFKNNKKCVKELLQEHKEKVKLKQWEYDLIDIYVCFKQKAFNIFDAIRVMKDKGYYKGVNDTNMTCQEILDNCVIVPDDYDFGGN